MALDREAYRNEKAEVEHAVNHPATAGALGVRGGATTFKAPYHSGAKVYI